MEFGASFDVVGDLDVRAAYVWGFISDPVKGNDGNTPEQSDTQLLLGVGYSF
jgi:hypothetical protein